MAKYRSDEEIEKEIMELHEQIRAKLNKIVEVEPMLTRPGRLNTKLSSEAMELEAKQWELIKELLIRQDK